MILKIRRIRFGLVSVVAASVEVTILKWVFIGKDYSNERVLEFHTLNKPFEDMYDRTKVPRMPWSVSRIA